MRKSSFKPLFTPNTFVDVTEETIEQVFVEGHNTPHRKRLASQLRLFLSYLKSLGLNSYEMWIDGSFTTVNPNPIDIDIVCSLPIDELMSMTDEDLKKLEYLASEEGRLYVREKWSVDYYHCPFDSLEERNYWKNKYSIDEFGSSKGIGRIKK